MLEDKWKITCHHCVWESQVVGGGSGRKWAPTIAVNGE